MTELPDYSKATNAAYGTLFTHDVNYPRVDVLSILENMGNVIIMTYSQMADRMGITFEDFYQNYASSEYGFTIRKDSKSSPKFIVCYNERKSETTIRFTLAHELAHIVLNHKKDDSVFKKEADCFARNVLCPIPIVNGYKLKSVKDYVNCFNISESMATVAIDFAQNDYYYITEENYKVIDNLSYSKISGMSLGELYG